MSKLHVQYIDKNSTADLVLLHGWGMNNGIWQQLIHYIETANCYLIDLPGHGQSQPLPSAPSLELCLEAWLEAIGKVLPQKPFYLCGWSLGGLIALALQQKFADQIKGLSLIATSPCFRARDDWHGLSALELDIFDQNLGDDNLSALRQFLALQFAGAHNSKGEMRTLLRNLRSDGKAHIEALQQGLYLLRNLDLRAEFANLGSHCQMLFGDKDPLITTEAAADIHALNHKINMRSWQCAHAPHFIFPARTAAWLGNMWRQ